MNAAQNALGRTDWMVIRMYETGKPIPESITDARQSLRDSVDASLDRLSGLSPTEYLDFAPVEVHTAEKAYTKIVDSLAGKDLPDDSGE